MKIVFMGTPDFAAVILQALLDSEHEICGVATQPDKAKDRGKKIQLTPVKELAILICDGRSTLPMSPGTLRHPSSPLWLPLCSSITGLIMK